MSIEAIIILLVAALGAGTLLAGRAGIRSIQRARKVVFYRTRKSYMLAGWQWLLLALVLFSSTVASALFGEPLANQILSMTMPPISMPFLTALPDDTVVVPSTETSTATGTIIPSETPMPTTAVSQTMFASQTATAALTPSPTPSATRTGTPPQTATITRTALPSPTANLSALASQAAETLRSQFATAALSRTPTRTRTSIPTASQTPTRTPTRTASPSITPNPNFTATASATRTPRPTMTLSATPTPRPTITSLPTPTPTFTATIRPSRTPLPTGTRTLLPTRTASSTRTARPSLTPTSTRTMRPTTTFTATASRVPSPTRTPMYRRISVYFTDNRRMITGQLPYEVAVTRLVPSSKDAIHAVLDEFFKGPSDVQRNQGLAVISNGFTGYSKIELANGGVYVYLAGTCQSNGTLYTIARPLMLNVKQFPEVEFVKIYDQVGNTGEPAARVDSVPACLDPAFTPSPTPLPTSTLRFPLSPTATRTSGAPLRATPYLFPTPPYR